MLRGLHNAKGSKILFGTALHLKYCNKIIIVKRNFEI
jgi:hypothetical protein